MHPMHVVRHIGVHSVRAWSCWNLSACHRWTRARNFNRSAGKNTINLDVRFHLFENHHIGQGRENPLFRSHPSAGDARVVDAVLVFDLATQGRDVGHWIRVPTLKGMVPGSAKVIHCAPHINDRHDLRSLLGSRAWCGLRLSLLHLLFLWGGFIRDDLGFTLSHELGGFGFQ